MHLFLVIVTLIFCLMPQSSGLEHFRRKIRAKSLFHDNENSKLQPISNRPTMSMEGFTAFLQLNQNHRGHPKDEMEKVQGRIELNGKMTDVDCDCSDDWKEKLKENKHLCKSPKKFRIQRIDRIAGGHAGFEEGMTAQELREFIGLPSQLKYVSISDAELSDMDGRSSSKVLGTSGGDAAEFISAVQVYADVLEISPTVKQMLTWFKEYLSTIRPRKFYMDTTVDAITSLQQELDLEGLDINSPRKEPRTLKSTLLGKCGLNRVPPCGLLDPINIGNTHIKLMLKYPGKFFVKKETVEAFIKVFYGLLWDGDDKIKKQLTLETLPSSKLSSERALVNVLVNDACRSEGRFPLIQVRKQRESVFINHPGAVDLRRRELAAFFANLSNNLISFETMYARIQSRGAAAFDATAKRIAKGLPVFNIFIE